MQCVREMQAVMCHMQARGHMHLDDIIEHADKFQVSKLHHWLLVLLVLPLPLLV